MASQKGPSVFYEQIRQTAKNTGSQLVIIDGLHDTFDGNENSRPEARAFVGMLRKIALETDGAVVLCAHPSLSGLNSGTGSSGSTAWNNAVRSRLYLTKPRDEAGEADPDVRVLKTVKANYGRSGDDIRIRWRNGAFVRDNVDAGGTVARIEDRNAEKAFLACLSALLAEGFDPSPAVEARGNYAPRLMRGRSEVRGFNERQLIKAMERLIAKGEVVQALTKR